MTATTFSDQHFGGSATADSPADRARRADSLTADAFIDGVQPAGGAEIAELCDGAETMTF